MPTAREILTNALRDINKLGADQNTIEPDDVALCVSKFNRRSGQWNAQKAFGAFEYTQVFTLPTAANSYTIGAAADSPALVVTAGHVPVEIQSAKRLLTSGGVVSETEIPVLMFDQWNRISTPGISTSLTLAVYLQTKPKLSVLWCYGFSSGEQLRLSWRSLLNSITVADLDTNIDLRDGYEDALTFTLSEDLAIPFNKPISKDLKDKATAARSVIAALSGKPAIAYPDWYGEGNSRSSTTEADFNARNVR